MDIGTNIQVRVTKHAHQQYCNRVETINQDELTKLCRQQIENKKYDYMRGNFMRLAGVWWVYELKNDVLTMITCYGKSRLFLPDAIRWAKMNRDRINLVRMI